MLYLPPGQAHDGVALDECTTYSIGFRAPSHQELVEAFLDRLRDTLTVPGRFADRTLRAARHPARLDPAALRQLAQPLARIRWSQRDVERFLGEFLSEPKAHVSFEPPSKPLGLRSFQARSGRAGIRLDLRTQLLYDARAMYLNGQRIDVAAGLRADLVQLADQRALTAARCRAGSTALTALLHDWYRHGYLEPASA